jgi:hypothetical protein
MGEKNKERKVNQRVKEQNEGDEIKMMGRRGRRAAGRLREREREQE